MIVVEAICHLAILAHRKPSESYHCYYDRLISEQKRNKRFPALKHGFPVFMQQMEPHLCQSIGSCSHE
jgi:hypothetical protein